MTNETKRKLPEVFSMEISLCAIASSTLRIADNLEELVKVTNVLADHSGGNNLSELESTLRTIADSMPDVPRGEIRGINRSLERLPANWDALDGIGHSLFQIMGEIKKRVDL